MDYLSGQEDWDEDKYPTKQERMDRAYIKKLEKENATLRSKVSELSTLAFNAAQASDRMKLELIISGCLTIPPKVTEPTEVKPQVVETPTFPEHVGCDL